MESTCTVRPIGISTLFPESSNSNRVMKEAYELLTIIGWGINYKGWDDMLQLYKTLIRSYGVLCTFLVTTPWKIHDLVLKDVAWIGELELARVIGWAGTFFPLS